MGFDILKLRNRHVARQWSKWRVGFEQDPPSILFGRTIELPYAERNKQRDQSERGKRRKNPPEMFVPDEFLDHVQLLN
jgi:hypothetical protein